MTNRGGMVFNPIFSSLSGKDTLPSEEATMIVFSSLRWTEVLGKIYFDDKGIQAKRAVLKTITSPL
jgi:hypothetical protein